MKAIWLPMGTGCAVAIATFCLVTAFGNSPTHPPLCRLIQQTIQNQEKNAALFEVVGHDIPNVDWQSLYQSEMVRLKMSIDQGIEEFHSSGCTAPADLFDYHRYVPEAIQCKTSIDHGGTANSSPYCRMSNWAGIPVP